jgi:hypothetical protein
MGAVKAATRGVTAAMRGAAAMPGVAGLKDWLRRRGPGLPRVAGAGASALLLFAITFAGWSVVPHAGPLGAGGSHGAADRTIGGASGVVPVFVMRPDHSVVRHGTAILEGDGRVNVSLFASTASEVPEATEALLFQPTVVALWAAAPDKARTDLKQRFEAVQEEAAHSFETLITSDVFTHLYRPLLSSILTDAVAHAWEDARTQAAFADVLTSSDAAFKRRMSDGLEAIVLSRVKEGVWDMLQSNWLNAFGVPLGYDLDYTPVTRAISGALQDPRLQQTLMEFGSERLSTGEARRLAERLVIGVVEALMSDRRVPDVVSTMFWDPRLRQMVRPFMDSASALGAALPRDLGGVGTGATLNPLAAHIFRAVLLGERTPLILFVTPEERSRIERLAPDAAKLLRPTARGRPT